MQYSISYKQQKSSDKVLKTSVLKKNVFFENIRTLILMFLILGSLLLSLNNNQLYLLEISAAILILIPVLLLKLITDNSTTK